MNPMRAKARTPVSLEQRQLLPILHDRFDKSRRQIASPVDLRFSPAQPIEPRLAAFFNVVIE